MAQWIKHRLSLKHEDLSLNSQNPYKVVSDNTCM